MSATPESVRLRQVRDYRFDCYYRPGKPSLPVDEPAPLGGGDGPSPVQLLASAVGSCLSASLLFALRKFKQQPDPIVAEVQPEVGRNADGRLRVLGLTATLRLGVPAAQLEHIERVLATFEAYCTVTQSVAAAIPVTVQVFDADGTRVK